MGDMNDQMERGTSQVFSNNLNPEPFSVIILPILLSEVRKDHARYLP